MHECLILKSGNYCHDKNFDNKEAFVVRPPMSNVQHKVANSGNQMNHLGYGSTQCGTSLNVSFSLRLWKLHG